MDRRGNGAFDRRLTSPALTLTVPGFRFRVLFLRVLPIPPTLTAPLAHHACRAFSRGPRPILPRSELNSPSGQAACWTPTYWRGAGSGAGKRVIPICQQRPL